MPEDRVVQWLVEATITSMGMHHYEEQIQAAILAQAGFGWHFRRRTVGSVRSEEPASIRIPDRIRRADVSWAAELAGRLAAGRTFTHRFDLRLPPAPREVVTVHDVPAMRFPDEGHLPAWSIASAAKALEVIVPSQFAADEVSRWSGASRITIVPYGLSDTFVGAPPATQVALDSLGIPGHFLVHAAGATARKNLSGLAGAWRRVIAGGTDHTLVLCGPPHPNRDDAFRDMPQVIFAGRQPPMTVAALMAASDGVVVPSLYEGFGLPALEGMAAGAPVLIADAGALPEVCADSALIARPDEESLADGIGCLLSLDAAQRTELTRRGRARAATFDWKLAAQRHLEIYSRYA